MRLIANVNPHLHFPAEREAKRQLDLGAVALKIHPCHGNFAANDAELYRTYALCVAISGGNYSREYLAFSLPDDVRVTN